jgi:hypothetical protein
VKSRVLKEFWPLVSLAGTCLAIFVVARGWWGAPVNLPGLAAGFAIAAIGLIGVVREEGKGAGHDPR